MRLWRLPDGQDPFNLNRAHRDGGPSPSSQIAIAGKSWQLLKWARAHVTLETAESGLPLATRQKAL
jgi:hypothetical protein